MMDYWSLGPIYHVSHMSCGVNLHVQDQVLEPSHELGMRCMSLPAARKASMLWEKQVNGRYRVSCRGGSQARSRKGPKADAESQSSLDLRQNMTKNSGVNF